MCEPWVADNEQTLATATNPQPRTQYSGKMLQIK